MLRERFDFRQRPAADRVLDHDERIVRQAQHARDVVRSHLERFSAKHNSALAKLFEADAIMQTAR